MRGFLQVVGLACLLAAAILFFIPQNKDSPTAEILLLQQEIKRLEDTLAHTERELAAAQTTSLAPKESTPVSVEKTDAEPIIKSILSIEQGTNSTAVADRLLKMGIIQDANEFELFLQQEGLSGKIQIGEYEVLSSMTIKEIAYLITK